MRLTSSIKKFIKSGLVVTAVLGFSAFQLPGTAVADVSLGGSQDCDANAVIYCGAQTSPSLISKYNSGTTQNSAKSIQDIFAKFNISSADVNALNTTAVAGRVTQNGEVYINSSSTAVASNALTVGRQNMPGSSQVTYNGTTMYTRAPGVSFRSSSLPAYVVMKDGVFQFAILASCANPVAATPKTPPTTPKITINKTVAARGADNYAKDVTVKTGTEVSYRIEVTSSGTEAANNVIVKDVLPADARYVPDTLFRGASRVTNDQAAKFFSAEGLNIGGVSPGQTISFHFVATVGEATTATSCTKETITNTGTVTATSVPATSSTAAVNKECEPVKPIVAMPVCKDFQIAAGPNRTINVTKFDYTTNGATFVNAVINWDVNKTNASSPAITDAGKVVGQTYQYSADGTYLVSVTITFTQDGKTVTSSGNDCQKQVAFTTETPVVTPPVKPVALVAAGAGSTIALFAAVVAAAAGIYHWSVRRRLGLQ